MNLWCELTLVHKQVFLFLNISLSLSLSLSLYLFLFLFLSLSLSLYIYIYTHTNLPVNAIVRLPHPHSGDSQGQEKFLAPSADKQIRNYDTRVLKPPSLPINRKP